MEHKIIHIVGQLVRGGAERQLLYLTESLNKRGWSQSVVTFSPGDVMEKSITALNIPIFYIPRHLIKPWRLLTLAWIVNLQRPEIIHSWSLHTNVYTSWLPPYPYTKRILSFRGNPRINSYSGEKRSQPPFACLYKYADCIVSNSHLAIKEAATSGVQIKRWEIVGNVVVARGRANPGIAMNVPKIVAAGTLSPLKAYNILLQALSLVHYEKQAFELFLAGEGGERPHLEALSKELQIDKHVRFLGEIEDPPSLFSSAQLLVHPSQSEGLSNTILEGMGEGLPVIASDVEGNRELINHEQNGILVPTNNPRLLANQIKRMLKDNKLRLRLGLAALQLVRERFNVEIVTNQYEGVYNSLLN